MLENGGDMGVNDGDGAGSFQQSGRTLPAWLGGVALGLVALMAAGCSASGHTSARSQSIKASEPSSSTSAPSTISTSTTLPPCNLTASSTQTGQSVPVNQVCSSAGAVHFATPQAAMVYLTNAWNSGNVRELDYVTDPQGRSEMDAIASEMVNLRFSSCSPNPGRGDYTCYFTHDIVKSSTPTTESSTSSTDGHPPGHAALTVAPASGPGWYVTRLDYCG